MRNKIFFFLSAVIVFFVFGHAFTETAHAFSVSPTIVDIEVDPGSIHQEYITLENDEAQPQSYRVFVRRFLPKGDSGQNEYLPETEMQGLPSWLSYASSFISLAPGERRRIPITIRVPVDTLAQGHYAAVFFSRERSIEPGRGGVSAGLRIGVLFFVNVKGAFVRHGTVQSFSMISPFRLTHLPAQFEINLRNNGNVHFSPSGNIRIVNIFGKTVASVPINSTKFRILPNSSRRVSVSWIKDDPLSEGGFFTELREQIRNFGIGPYRARLEFSDSFMKADGIPEILFWVFPIHLIVFCVFLFIVCFLCLRWYRGWVLSRARI